MKSKKFSLSRNNIIKGIVMAMGSAVVMTLLPFFVQGSGKDIWDISIADLKTALTFGINAGVTYIVATFFTDSTGKFVGLKK